MHSALKPEHYLDQENFKLEESLLFGRLWIYACFKSSVNYDQAYATRKIGGRYVLIQNFNGTIKAFENACAHRLMPMHNESFGQAKMVCPYHGWVYDDSGKVKTIPKQDKLYQFTEAEKKQFHLKEYKVEIFGGLVFINLDVNPIPITEQFSSELIRQLSDVSVHFGEVSVHVEIPVKYNWKLNYENVLDHQHVPYIHPNTFLPNIKTGIELSRQDRPLYPVPSSKLSDQSFFSAMDYYVKPWPWHDLVHPYGLPNTYHNHFIFPNVNFISVGGLTFLVQQFEPVSATETIVKFTLCAARTKSRLPALPAILRAHLKGEVDVFMEDVYFLSKLQESMHTKLPNVVHGKYEHALMGFGLTYLQWLQIERPC
jgi:hypothetical protein